MNPALFGVLPFISMMLFFIGTIYRYRSRTFTYSSLSTQLLENKHHFWAVVPFHYGIIAVITGHIVAFFIPRQILLWNRAPLRLYILELSALVFGISALIGFAAIVARRLTDTKVRVVTTTADWILYGLLLLQLFTGVYVAVFLRWGSSWFSAALVPYLWSLIKLNPDISAVSVMPWMAKLHIINAWLVIAFFPFTRLVHILVVPNQYLFRKRQVVRWYRPRPAESKA